MSRRVSIDSVLQDIKKEAEYHLRHYGNVSSDEWLSYQEGVLDCLNAINQGMDKLEQDRVYDVLNEVYNSRPVDS